MENDSKMSGTGWVKDRMVKIHPPREWHPNTARAWANLGEQRILASGRVRRWTWIATTVALASVSLATFPVTREFILASSSEPSISRMNTEAGRKLAPDFTLEDSAGRPVRLSEFRGKVVLLNFWATWCARCQTEIPWFVEFQQTNRDLVVLGVSLDEEGWTAVRPYMREKGVNYRVMLGNDEVVGLYEGLPSLPTTLIIDKSGRIAVMHVGLCSKNDYESEMKALLAER